MIPIAWQWFSDSRYGLFIHWGPYAHYGRGEQVLYREHLDQHQYALTASQWNPSHYDAQQWAQVAVKGGFRYAVLTTRHHDGYCLWDSKQTNYTAMKCAPGRDFVQEYIQAFRAAGLRVGLYYSLADWRSAAYWSSPKESSPAWYQYRDTVHQQVRELLTQYGKIDVFWFDGAWPHSAAKWDSHGLVHMMRHLQPDILINNRLDSHSPWAVPNGTKGHAAEAPGESAILGDFGTPEQHITADPSRLWESCMTTTWRWWGYAQGERWHAADQWLDRLCQAVSQGGNLLLNVGPHSDGRLPEPFLTRASDVGRWLQKYGQSIYGCTRGDVTEFSSKGWQTRHGNTLYLIYRFWPGQTTERIAEFQTPAVRATLMTTSQPLPIDHQPDAMYLTGLPEVVDEPLFPVIKLEFAHPPAPKPWAEERLWKIDPQIMKDWAIE